MPRTVSLQPVDEDADQPLEGAGDLNLEHLSQEERMKLALTAIESGTMSERGAVKYFQVPRRTLQDRRKGVLPRKEAHDHERKLSAA
jgi:hypothetical protein